MSKRHKKPRFRGIERKRVHHFMLKASQRYGVVLHYDDVEEIGRLIREGKSEHLGDTSNVRSHHRLTYQGKEMIIVYHKLHKIPLTALSKEEYERRALEMAQNQNFQGI